MIRVLTPVSSGGDTSDATAVAAEILTGKTAYIATGKVNGAMPDNGAAIITPSAEIQAIPEGYHNGEGYVEAMVDSGSSLAYGEIGYGGAVGPQNSHSFNTAIGEGKTQGRAVIYSATAPRNSIIVFFDTVSNNSLCVGPYGSGYQVAVWTRKYLGRLTDSGTSGYVPKLFGNEYYRLLDCYIVGTNLYIRFENTSTSQQNFDIKGTWEVW